MRGELSPPSPTPSNPVGGDVVDVRAPKPVCVLGSPGTPAIAVGSAKFGAIEQIEHLQLRAQFRAVGSSPPAWSRRGRSTEELGPAHAFAAEIVPNWHVAGESPPTHAPVLGSTAETKAVGFSHWSAPGGVTPGIGVVGRSGRRARDSRIPDRRH